MPTVNEMIKSVEQGDFDALLPLCDALAAQGDWKGRAYWLEYVANQTDKQTEPGKLNRCLYAMRNLGMMLSNIGANEEGDADYVPGYENADPKRALELYQRILDKYPNERQAMFAKHALGLMYYDERYKRYGVPHNPDKGMALIKEWESECAKTQGLSTVPMLCTDVGTKIFAGRYPVSTNGGLEGRDIDDMKYAKNLLQNVGADSGQYYELAKILIESIDRIIPIVGDERILKRI